MYKLEETAVDIKLRKISNEHAVCREGNDVRAMWTADCFSHSMTYVRYTLIISLNFRVVSSGSFGEQLCKLIKRKDLSLL
jgi:hypothetical protein